MENLDIFTILETLAGSRPELSRWGVRSHSRRGKVHLNQVA